MAGHTSNNRYHANNNHNFIGKQHRGLFEVISCSKITHNALLLLLLLRGQVY